MLWGKESDTAAVVEGSDYRQLKNQRLCLAARNRNQLWSLDRMRVNFYPIISSGSTSSKLLVQWFQETLSIMGSFCLRFSHLCSVALCSLFCGSYSYGQFLVAMWQVQVQHAVCISEYRKKEGPSKSGEHPFHKSKLLSEGFIRPSLWLRDYT